MGYIRDIIEKHDLKPGDMMKNVVGEEVSRTLVLSSMTYLIQDTADSYMLVQENPLTDEARTIYIHADTMKVLQEFNLNTFEGF